MDRRVVEASSQAASVLGSRTLGHGEIHVWRVRLGRGRDVCRAFERTLSAEEQKRVKRHFHRDDRERFVLTRCMVRDVLGRCLETDPTELRFMLEARGKPALAGKWSWLRFNVSHSGELCLVAVAAAEVGVDVELIRDVDVNLLARRAFPGNGPQPFVEDADERRRMFFARWTRQEACLKAHGAGLAGLSRLHCPQADRYSVVDLPLEDGYAAAVAYTAGSLSRVVVRTWPACRLFSSR